MISDFGRVAATTNNPAMITMVNSSTAPSSPVRPGVGDRPSGNTALPLTPSTASTVNTPLADLHTWAKELRVEHVFRYANIYDRAINLLASGKIDVKPLISKTYSFDQAVEAFEFAAKAPADIIKTQIVFD